MKKTITLHMILVILFCFLTTFFSSCNRQVAKDQTTLHISPMLCESMLYGITPTDFCTTKGAGTFLEGRYLQAHVDDDGCLILTLENETISEWKNSFTFLQILQCVLGENRDIGITIDYSKDFLDMMKDAHACGYEISEDFTKVVESSEDSSWYFPFTTLACAIMQVFEGKTCTEIKVEHIEIDADGKVIDTFIFPDDSESFENDEE